MSILLEDKWLSNNPGGIIVNLGYYALAEAICTNHSVQVVLSKWCGISEKKNAPIYKKYGNRIPMDIDKLKMLMDERFMSQTNVGDMAGCSAQKISGIFCKRIFLHPPEFIEALEDGFQLPRGSLLLKKEDENGNL